MKQTEQEALNFNVSFLHDAFPTFDVILHPFHMQKQKLNIGIERKKRNWFQ